MNQAKILISIALVSVLVSGCASYGTQEYYNSAIVDAKKSLKTANKANYEWRDSGKILDKADKAAQAGDFLTATKLADEAKYQGDMALAQSKVQENAGPR